MVSERAKAAAHVDPKYVYDDVPFECPGSVQSFAAVVKGSLNGTYKGSAEEKDIMQTEIMLEVANFRSKRGWFQTDTAKSAAKRKSEFDF